MIKLPKGKFKRIISFSKRLPRVLAVKSFLTFLVLLLTFAGIGSAIFYKYSVLPESEKSESKEKLLLFKKNMYDDILAAWQEREVNFREADSKDYFNPFAPSSTNSELTK